MPCTERAPSKKESVGRTLPSPFYPDTKVCERQPISNYFP
ncbi:hypothetical protein ALIPUT_01498 [Alistipes putredinis DSM 17216]|uniref:Uncharacterized protein n=1 Tax=Alistipes putredinis DSM 17216 TaxID=445970 RepID=B0MWI7_9BACT|nr:hypothetical protein ALIPUT_01498 [Alistipes putredinis DSM 17216]